MKKKEKFIKKDNEFYKKKAEEYLAGWKRAKADFVNYKRRREEEQREFLQFARAGFVMQILPVLDHFDEGVKHIPDKEKSSSWVEGILYIKKQLEDVLEKNGVQEIRINKGAEFNPEVMEAVKQEIGDKKKNRAQKENGARVKRLLCRGYKLNGKLIRPAKVIVE